MKLSGQLLVKFSFQQLKRSKMAGDRSRTIISRGTKKGSPDSFVPASKTLGAVVPESVPLTILENHLGRKDRGRLEAGQNYRRSFWSNFRFSLSNALKLRGIALRALFGEVQKKLRRNTLDLPVGAAFCQIFDSASETL